MLLDAVVAEKVSARGERVHEIAPEDPEAISTSTRQPIVMLKRPVAFVAMQPRQVQLVGIIDGHRASLKRQHDASHL